MNKYINKSINQSNIKLLSSFSAIVQMTTTSGLSSIASLSLGLSMSMSIDGGSSSAAATALRGRLDAALVGTRSPHPCQSSSPGPGGVLHSAANRLRRCSLFPPSTSASAAATPTTPTTGGSPSPFAGGRGPLLQQLHGCGGSLGSTSGIGGGGAAVRPPMRRQSALCVGSSAADFGPTAAATSIRSYGVGNSAGFRGRGGTESGGASSAAAPAGCFLGAQLAAAGPPIAGRLGLSPVDERAAGDAGSAIVDMSSDDERRGVVDVEVAADTDGVEAVDAGDRSAGGRNTDDAAATE